MRRFEIRSLELVLFPHFLFGGTGKKEEGEPPGAAMPVGDGIYGAGGLKPGTRLAILAGGFFRI